MRPSRFPVGGVKHEEGEISPIHGRRGVTCEPGEECAGLGAVLGALRLCAPLEQMVDPMIPR